MLTKDQRKRLHAALLDGFSDADLRQFVRFDLGENLAAIAGGSNLDATVFNLIEWSERHGQTVGLVIRAAAARPGNAELTALAAGLEEDFEDEPGDEAEEATGTAGESPPSSPPAKNSPWSVGTINATNVTLGGDQINDQRKTEVNTGGGAYIGGNVEAGRDFIGRDRIVYGDENPTLGHDDLFASLSAAVLLKTDAPGMNEVIRLLDELKRSWAARADVNVAATLAQIAALTPTAIPDLVENFSAAPLQEQLGPVATATLGQLRAR